MEWLKGAARAAKCRSTHPATQIRAGPRDPSDPGQTPSQIVLRLEEQMEISRAVAQLPPDYQEIIILRNLERLPFDEIAERMGRSRPAVQMLWMRALKKLHESLDP